MMGAGIMGSLKVLHSSGETYLRVPRDAAVAASIDPFSGRNEEKDRCRG